MKNFIEEKINLIWEEAPIGCAYLKMNYLENGEIENLYFLRLNSALKEMLGLEEDIEGESLETLLPGISYENEKWKSHIENASKRKDDNVFFYHSDILDKSFVVKLYSYDEEHVILYIDDITQEIKVANAGEKLLQQTGEDIDYHQIASIMCDISGARYAAFNIFAENGKEFITRALVAADSDVEKVISILGYSINNKKWSYDPLRDKIIEGKTITRFDNLSEIADHIIPQKAVNMIERLFNTGQVYIVKIKKDGEMLGDFTLIMNKGESLIREDLVKIYAKQVGLFLDKKRAEEKLKKSQERLLLAVDAGEHCFWDWNIESGEIYFSPGFYRMLGYEENEISINTFSDWSELLHPDDYEKTVQEIKRHALKNRSYISEYRLKCSDGKYRWFSERGKNFKKLDAAKKGRMAGIIIDIHERKMKEEKIKELNNELKKEKAKALEDNRKLKILFENLTEPIVMIDDKNKIIDINKQFEKVFKYRLEEIKGKDIFILMDENPSQQIRKYKEELIFKGSSIEIESIRYDKYGSAVPCLIKAFPINISGDIIGGYIMYIDISELKKKEQEIRYISFHDSLTGLYNRTYFEEEIKRIDTKRNIPISIIMADLNNLKLVNDSYGHQKGDQLLKFAADIIKDACREDDIVARWGGDEFIIVLPQTEESEAKKVIDRIVSTENSKDSILKEYFSISFGTAAKTDRNEDISHIIEAADNNMYKNKLVNRRSNHSSILNAILKTLETKSFETAEHSTRIKESSHMLGKEINLASVELDKLSLLSYLHDIGKVAVSEKILKKKEKLNKEEWEEIKKHSETGYRIAVSTDEFSHIAKEILNHHERWDGSGYPEGLKGDEIPLLSRILAVVDAYDIMLNGRPYKNKKSVEDALLELKNNAGSQFDPELVEKFVEIIEKENKIL